MTYHQSIEGCLQRTIGARGLSEDAFSQWLDRLREPLKNLQASYHNQTLPLLNIVHETEDIERASEALERLSKGAELIVFFGTGGSSLGGQMWAQFSGWNIPGEMIGSQQRRPRTRFYDNLDPRSLLRALEIIDLEHTRFIVISKSGNTPETLVQTIVALQAVRERGLGAQIPDLFLGLTEPEKEGQKNGLRALLSSQSIPMLDHHSGIGGRFSVLANVGLLPALARGLNVRALRTGAANVVEQMAKAAEPSELPAAIGAAIAVGLAREAGISATAIMPYSDRLGKFSHWYVQLWSESLGKEGEGTLPVAALGPLDQHARLQYFMDGPPHIMISLLRTALAGEGAKVAPELAERAGLDYLSGRHVGDLVGAQQVALEKALLKAGRPVRTIDIDPLNEQAMGALAMHFMIETILAARLFGINPFDQPAVEMGKIFARDMLQRD